MYEKGKIRTEDVSKHAFSILETLKIKFVCTLI